MKRLTVVLVFLAVTAARPASADPILITTSTDAAALVANLLGPGIAVVAGSETLIGAATQQGTFTGGTGILPFDAGIILTSGAATSAPGPNNSEATTTITGTGGNLALTALAGSSTFDQNVLSFDFVPDANVISFQFVFASEEYHEWVNSSFNDVFGFFLNDTNIALVPGTAAPITINSINCTSNSAFYHANSATSPCFNAASAVNTQYDGLAGGLFALPLFATGPVNAGAVNTIVLAIADAGDSALDSAVFLAAGSFVAQPPPPPNGETPPNGDIPEPASLLLLGVGLAGVGWRGRLRRVE